ncbi:MAG: hypothetical protein GJ680_19785 [Alteromonadaceae bacterium]|nr:hypothetical protein [Alteromonadaceae bacterium]
MSTFLPTNQIPTPLATTAQPNSLKSAPQLNPGTPIILQSVTPAQISISTSTGKVTIPTIKPANNLQAGKEFVAKISQQNQTTILEIASKYLQKHVTLSAAQSQQVFASIAQTPSSIVSNSTITGKVVSQHGNQVEIAVNNQRLTVPVTQGKNFVPGQLITVKLSGSQNQWQLQAEQGSTKSQQALTNQTAAKILDSFSKLGNKLASAPDNNLLNTTNNALKNEINGKLEKVQLSQTPAGEVKVSLQVSKEPLASIKISSEIANKLVANGVKTDTKFQLDGTKHQTNISSSEVRNSTNTHSTSAVYANPSVGTKSPLASQPTKGVSNPADTKFVDTVLNEAKNASINAKAAESFVTKPESQNINITPGQADKLIGRNEKTLADTKDNHARSEIKTNTLPPQPQEIKLGQADKVSRTSNIEAQILTDGEPRKTQNSPPRAESTIPKSENAQSRLEGPQSNNINRLLKRFNIETDVDTNQAIGKILSRVNDLMNQLNRPSLTETQVQQLVKQLLAGTPSPAPMKAHLDLGIQLNELAQQSISSELKSQLNELKQTISPDTNRIINVQSEQIKQLLQAPTLPTTTNSIQSVVSNSSNSFVAGLVSLLQLSLGAKLSQQQPKLAEQTAQVLTTLLAGTSNLPNRSSVSSKNLREFSGLEQKKQLLKLAGELLNNHSQQKLNNAEKMVQGQEVFHYILPYGQGQQEKPFELLIKREQERDKSTEKDKFSQSIWSLTMKLTVGEIGEALTKARIDGSKVDIDFYTSNAKLKDLILNFFPFLKKRLDVLGITMKMGKCEQGQIPESLQERPYQLLETRV